MDSIVCRAVWSRTRWWRIWICTVVVNTDSSVISRGVNIELRCIRCTAYIWASIVVNSYNHVAFTIVFERCVKSDRGPTWGSKCDTTREYLFTCGKWFPVGSAAESRSCGMFHINIQGTWSRFGVRHLEGDSSNITGTTNLSSGIYLFYERIFIISVGRDVAIGACAATHCNLLDFVSLEDGKHSDIERWHCELVVCHGNWVVDIARLKNQQSTQEVISIRCCGQGDGLTRQRVLLVSSDSTISGIGQCNGKALSEAGGHGDITVRHDEGVVIRHCDNLVVGCKDFPTWEEITVVCVLSQSNDVACISYFLISTDCSVCSLSHCDGIAVTGEVGDIVASCINLEAVGGVSWNHIVIQGPVLECVTCIGSSGQGGCCALLICITACHSSTNFRFSRHCDSVICAVALTDCTAEGNSLWNAAGSECQALVIVVALSQTSFQTNVNHLLDISACRCDAEWWGVCSVLSQANLISCRSAHCDISIQVSAN